MKKEKIIETEKTEEVVDAPAQDAKKEKPVKITKVGAMLKEMRLQKGLKVVDISKKLCIRKCYLEAIEESNYKEIPAFPYGVGFIRSYSNFLGLNGENIVELYKEETSGVSAKDIHVLEPQPEASMPGIQYLLISLLAIAAIYAGWMFFNQSSDDVVEATSQEQAGLVANEDSGVVVVEEFSIEANSQPVEAMPQEEKSENTEDNQIVVSDDVYVEEPAKETVSEEKEDVKKEETKPEPKTVDVPKEGVFIEVLTETWIEVKDENKLYISKVLNAGDTYKVPEGKGKILTVGKHDGVKVYVNGVLTEVVRPYKKRNIALDNFLEANR